MPRSIAGIRRVILVAPTGSGKTVILADIVRTLARSAKRVMVLAHRREIITQTSDKLLAADVVSRHHPGRSSAATARACAGRIGPNAVGAGQASPRR